MVAGAAAMDAALVALGLKLGFDLCRPVGAVGPHLAAGVGLIQYLIELLAVVNGGVGLGITADELVLTVDADVVLVAVEGLLVLLGPTRVFIFLRILGRFFLPPFGRLARLDRLVLLAAVVLLGRADNGGVYDLAPTRNVALGIEMAMKTVKQLLDHAGIGQRLAKQPHRGRVGHGIFQAESKKAHEREAIADKVFHVFIGQIVERLQHQDLEHQHGVEGLATGLALPLFAREPDYRLDLATEALEGNDRLKRLQRIALGANCLETLVEIVKPI